MTHAQQAETAQAAGSYPPPKHDPGPLGQAIASRLLSAGLDLHFALALAGAGPAAQRLEHAIAELDEALKDLRRLMLALLPPAAAATADPAAVDIRSRHPAYVADRSRARR